MGKNQDIYYYLWELLNSHINSCDIFSHVGKLHLLRLPKMLSRDTSCLSWFSVEAAVVHCGNFSQNKNYPPSFLPSFLHRSGTCRSCAFISQALVWAQVQQLQPSPWPPWTTQLPPGSSLEPLVLSVLPSLRLGVPVRCKASSGRNSGVFCGYVSFVVVLLLSPL